MRRQLDRAWCIGVEVMWLQCRRAFPLFRRNCLVVAIWQPGVAHNSRQACLRWPLRLGPIIPQSRRLVKGKATLRENFNIGDWQMVSYERIVLLLRSSLVRPQKLRYDCANWSVE